MAPLPDCAPFSSSATRRCGKPRLQRSSSSSRSGLSPEFFSLMPHHQGTAPALRSSDKKAGPPERARSVHGETGPRQNGILPSRQSTMAWCHSSESWLKPRFTDMSKHCSQVGLSGLRHLLLELEPKLWRCWWRAPCRRRQGWRHQAWSGQANGQQKAGRNRSNSHGISSSPFTPERRKSPPRQVVSGCACSVNPLAGMAAVEMIEVCGPCRSSWLKDYIHISVSTYPRPLRAALCMPPPRSSRASSYSGVG